MGLPTAFDSEMVMIRVAREIAMDMHDITRILEIHSVTEEEFERFQNNKHFQELVASEIATWQGSLNTSERVKLKSGAMVEDWLQEAHARLHDNREALNSKVELGKLIARLAGYGITGAEVRDETSRFSLQIIINPSTKVNINAPMKTIEHEEQ